MGDCMGAARRVRAVLQMTTFLRYFAVLITWLLASFAQGRTWTNVDGRKISAEFVQLEGENVVLKMSSGSRQEVRVKLETLSDGDQQFAREASTKGNLAELKDREKYFSAVREVDCLSIPRLTGKRLTYTEKPSWIFLTVASSSSKSLSNISSSAMMAVIGDGDIAELAEGERNLHARNYDTAEVFDLKGGEKLLVYTSFESGGKRLRERRCMMWKKMGDSVVKIDFIDMTFTTTAGRTQARQVMEETLDGLRFNGESLKATSVFVQFLFGADADDLSEVAKRAETSEDDSFIKIASEGDTVVAPRFKGDHLEVSVHERDFSLHLFVERKELGVSPSIAQFVRVSIYPAKPLDELVAAERKSNDGRYNTVEVRTLKGDEKLLVYSRLDSRGRKATMRRCVVWKKFGESVVTIAMEDVMYGRNPCRDLAVETMTNTIKGLRLNGEKLVCAPVAIDYLYTGKSDALFVEDLFRR